MHHLLVKFASGLKILTNKAIIFNEFAAPFLTFVESHHFFKVKFSLHAIDAIFYQYIHNVAKLEPFHCFAEDV